MLFNYAGLCPADSDIEMVAVALNNVETERERSLRTIALNAPHYERSGSWPEASLNALAQAGLLGFTVPTQFGGLSLGPSDFVSVVEDIAAACASTAVIFVSHVSATQVIKDSLLPDRAAVLSDIANGKHVSTLAFSETGSLSRFWIPVSQASKRNGAHVLNCKKLCVIGAGPANSYVVSTLPIDATNSTDSTLYYVEADTPGLSVKGAGDVSGLRASASATMRFDNCHLSPESRLTSDGDGFNTIHRIVLPWLALGSAAVAAGIARAALETTIQYLKGSCEEHSDVLFLPRSISAMQLARSRAALDASSALITEAALSIEKDDHTATLKILEVKAYAYEIAFEVIDTAMRLCAGAGFNRYSPVERYFCNARAGSVVEPTTDALYNMIGRLLLNVPLF